MRNDSAAPRLPLGGRPNPQGGFGWGSVPFRLIEPINDPSGDGGGISQRTCVPEAQDAIPLASHPRVAHRIMRGLRAVGMMAAVKFDDEPRFKTDKVCVIGTRRMSPPELPAVIALQSQMTPQGALRRRCVLSEIARALVGHQEPPPEIANAISTSPQGGGEETTERAPWPN